MKPSPEQVREWAEKAGAKFDPHWGISYNVGTATFERFAELAASWGASQAQQTTEPELPEAAVNISPYDPNHVYWNAGHPNDGVNSPLFTASQMHDHYQAGVRAGMGQSQWRTIDSAPKDGVKVLAFTNDGYKYPLVCQCVWGDGSWWPDAWESPDEPLKPTHWMPLPPPPMQGDSQ